MSLLDDLGAEDRATQRRACDELRAKVADDPELARSLLEVLHKGNPRGRFSAAWVLFHTTAPSLRLLPALLDALELPDGDLRWTAAHLLAVLGRMQAEVYPALLHEARMPERPAVRRRMALYALRELAPERAETAHGFLEALDDASADVRRAALTSFAKLIDPPAALLERALAIAETDPDPKMRRIAVIVLPDLVAHHPGQGERVRRALVSLQTDEDAPLQRAVQAASTRLVAKNQE